jgi:hypothetical protein
LPAWIDKFGVDARAVFQRNANWLLLKKFLEVQSGEPSITCGNDSCGALGYKMFSTKDVMKHIELVHNIAATDSNIIALAEIFKEAMVESEEVMQYMNAKTTKRGLEIELINEERRKPFKRERFIAWWAPPST